MTAQYAFSFDARYCSGCKACQAACKDKNDLPPGVLWRRVYEVSGGTWQQQGEAWQNNVFAYNLSIACNHCIHPKCAGVCPTNAYVIREDGIVLLDSTRCVGCGYCSWACPYGAPQYNEATGRMTKCDFCYDNLEQGLPPACVAACPLRVLDRIQMESSTTGLALWDTPSESHPYPLPSFSHTEPRLTLTPHPAMSLQGRVANCEEIKPQRPSGWAELPLIAFTLLTQFAVGAFWLMCLNYSLVNNAENFLLLPLMLIGASLGAGMLASFGHLGTKRNVWRVFSNLRKSSLSREILFTILFGLGWLVTTLSSVLWHQSTVELMALTSILGVGLIHNMSRVYRFPAGLSWNSWRTNLGFVASALLLGIAGITAAWFLEAGRTGIEMPYLVSKVSSVSIVALLLTQLAIMPRQVFFKPLQSARIGLILGAALVNVAVLLQSDPNIFSKTIITVLLIVGEEVIGRWLFYASQIKQKEAFSED